MNSTVLTTVAEFILVRSQWFLLPAAVGTWLVVFLTHGPTSIVPVSRGVVDKVVAPQPRAGAPLPPPLPTAVPATTAVPYKPGEEPFLAPPVPGVWTVYSDVMETLGELVAA